MALLIRTSMEKRNMRKIAMVLMHLSATAMLSGLPAMSIFYSTGAMVLTGYALGPSRRYAEVSPLCFRRVLSDMRMIDSRPQLADGHQPCCAVELRQHVHRGDVLDAAALSQGRHL